jgi:nucleotide-binding universal stress UspA family protein
MFQSILVPLDGSGYSERALATASELARLSGGRLTLLTVILAYKDVRMPHVEHLDRHVQDRAEAYLAPFVEGARMSGFDVKPVVARGEPAVEILGAAVAASADLIVMSTHGIGASGRHALGSVAMKVLQGAQCPVLMVRITDEAP